jgi:hypothetical protein
MSTPAYRQLKGTLSPFFCSLVLFSSPVVATEEEGARARCRDEVAALVQRFSDAYVVSDGGYYVRAGVMPSEKGYLGPVVSGRRTLEMSLYLRDAEGRSSTLRGKEQFQQILRHFAGAFDQILGAWISPNAADELSDNLDQFNRLTAAGSSLSVEEAARQTWTGKLAVEAGYSKVEVLSLEGTRGNYRLVKFLFSKP